MILTVPLGTAYTDHLTRPRVRPRRLDRLRQALEPVAAHDQHVLHAPVGEIGADVGPERRALGVLDPDPQHVLDALEVHADGDVGCLLYTSDAADE